MKPHITKLLANTITNQELLELKEWLANPKNQSILETYIKDSHDLNLAILKNNIDDAFNKVINKIEENEKNIKEIPLYKRNLFKYAAVILILVSIGSFFLINENKTNPNIPIIVNNNISIGTNKAILTLEDGYHINLEKGENYITDNLSSNGEEIIYKSPASVESEIAYNYLTIPRGGVYFVKLPDGTQVWLNSESKLKYPVNFIKGETRQVELVYGEAYFDISPSSENNDSKFKVCTGTQEVEVLGTEFNIKAYNDEDYIYTTLIEGKVAIANNDNKEILKPNEQAVLDTINNNFVVVDIDAFSEIAWRKGLFSFKNKSLKDIMKVLSRWYDVNVVFVNKSLEDVQFKGVLSKNQNIEDILTLIKNTNFINAYDIKNSTILLK